MRNARIITRKYFYPDWSENGRRYFTGLLLTEKVRAPKGRRPAVDVVLVRRIGYAPHIISYAGAHPLLSNGGKA